MDATTAIDNLCIRLRNGSMQRQAFLEECMRLLSESIRCTRAGLWALSDHGERKALRCLVMYDTEVRAWLRPADRLEEDSEAYLACLHEVGHVLAEDAQTHPATQDFYERSLRPNGVVSLLSTAFALNGEVFGVLTCSQVGERIHWTRRHLASVNRFGSRLSLALASSSPNQLNTLFGTE